ncbi:MAG: type secretion protein Rhs [Frankiales bacterium]|nr:type secretion protein Rhs [Frankiales bacterium]
MPVAELSVTYDVDVRVNGTPLSAEVAAMLTRTWVEQSLNEPSMFLLSLHGTPATTLDKAGVKVGAAVTVGVKAGAATVTLFQGEVTTVEVEIDGHGTTTTVRGMDVSHRLFARSSYRAFLEMKASDVVRRVVSEAGIRAANIQSLGQVVPHQTQEGLTDWQFLRRLAASVGAQMFVRDGGFHFQTIGPKELSAPVAELGVGGNVTHLRASLGGAGQRPEVEVRGWSPKDKKEVVGKSPVSAPGVQLTGSVTPKALAQGFRAGTLVRPSSRLTGQAACTDLATSLSHEIGRGFLDLEATLHGCPDIAAGKAVRVKDVGQPFDGTYVVMTARHEVEPIRGYTTSISVSSRATESLFGLTEGGAGSLVGRHAGPHVGIVTNINDDEHLGRVKVKLPVQSDDYETHWARVVQGAAGAGQSTNSLPEVGDEVLVLFGMGDVDEPYVVGGLYNGKDKPKGDPGADNGKVSRRSFTSRSGMVVEMVEKPGEERLTLSTTTGKNKVSLVQKGAAKIEIVSEGPVEVTAKQDVVVKTGAGDVTVEGVNITIKAKANLELSGADVKVKGTAAAEVSAPAVKVAGTGTAELSSSGMTTVRGSVVKIN